MKKNRHHFFLGIFVLVGFLLLASSVTILGANKLFEDYLMIETYIEESVSGLEKGSAVKFRGISIGKVQTITIVSRIYRTQKSYAYVLVKVFIKDLPTPAGGALDQRIEDRVIQGLRVSLSSSAITGSSYLECAYVPDPTETPKLDIDWTPTEVYVPSVPSTLLRFQHSLDALLDNLAKTDIQGVVAAARDTLRVFEKSMTDLNLSGISKSAQVLLDRAGSAVETAGKDIDGMSTEINTTLAQIRTQFGNTLKNADRTLVSINEVIDSGELKKSFSRLATVLDNADLAVKDLRALASRTDRTVAGVEQIVRGRGREVEIAISSLRVVLQNLSSLTSTLQEFPSLLFVGNAPKRRGESAAHIPEAAKK